MTNGGLQDIAWMQNKNQFIINGKRELYAPEFEGDCTKSMVERLLITTATYGLMQTNDSKHEYRE